MFKFQRKGGYQKMKLITREDIELLPTNDLIFKRIYGREGSERITEDFIKAFLDLDVKIDKLDNSEPLETDITSEKVGVLDVLATTVEGIRINIEMQVGNYENLEEKIAFYGCELFVKNFKRGQNYNQVQKTIAVIILKDDYKKYKEYEEYRLKWNLREEKYHDLILTKNLELYIISLDKIRKQIAKGSVKEKDKVAIWTKFLLTPKELKEEEMEENKEVKEAKKMYNDFLEDDLESLRAAKRHLFLMDQNYLYEELPKQKAKEIAKKMLDSNESIEKIIEYTGLTKEEIEELK